MATTRKKTELNQEQIVSWYTDYCLLHGKKPKSVYEFSQLNNFDEVNFYKFFNKFFFNLVYENMYIYLNSLNLFYLNGITLQNEVFFNKYYFYNYIEIKKRFVFKILTIYNKFKIVKYPILYNYNLLKLNKTKLVI